MDDARMAWRGQGHTERSAEVQVSEPDSPLYAGTSRTREASAEHEAEAGE